MFDNLEDAPRRPRAADRPRARGTSPLGISDDGFAPLLRGVYDELRYADASLLAFFTAKAAWRPMTRVYRDIEVHLARGELPASWRDLERATGLAVGTLQDIVARLKSAGKLQSRICKTPVQGAVHHGIHASVQGVTVYLVVDYPSLIDSSEEAVRTPRRTQSRTPPRTQEEESPLKNPSEEETPLEVPSSESGLFGSLPKRTPQATKKRTRGTPLPPDWVIPPALKAELAAERPDVDLDLQERKFRRYYTSGNARRKVFPDWDAKLRDWFDNIPRRNGIARNGRSNAGGIVNAIGDMLSELGGGR